MKDAGHGNNLRSQRRLLHDKNDRVSVNPALLPGEYKNAARIILDFLLTKRK